MAATGFGAGAQRWVSLMHNTSAKVAFGTHSDFVCSPGVFQGSPLSPLLFVLCLWPSRCCTRQTAGHTAEPTRPQPPRWPGFTIPAPPSGRHASTPADAQAVLDGSIALHVGATGARLLRSKSSGMGIDCLQPQASALVLLAHQSVPSRAQRQRRGCMPALRAGPAPETQPPWQSPCG